MSCQHVISHTVNSSRTSPDSSRCHRQMQGGVSVRVVSSSYSSRPNEGSLLRFKALTDRVGCADLCSCRAAECWICDISAKPFQLTLALSSPQPLILLLHSWRMPYICSVQVDASAQVFTDRFKGIFRVQHRFNRRHFWLAHKNMSLLLSYLQWALITFQGLNDTYFVYTPQ